MTTSDEQGELAKCQRSSDGEHRVSSEEGSSGATYFYCKICGETWEDDPRLIATVATLTATVERLEGENVGLLQANEHLLKLAEGWTKRADRAEADNARLTAEVERLDTGWAEAFIVWMEEKRTLTVERDALRAEVETERGYRQTAARLLGNWESQSDVFTEAVGFDYFGAIKFLLSALDASDALEWSGDGNTFERIAQAVGYDPLAAGHTISLEPQSDKEWCWWCSCGESGWGLLSEESAQREANRHVERAAATLTPPRRRDVRIRVFFWLADRIWDLGEWLESISDRLVSRTNRLLEKRRKAQFDAWDPS